MTTTTSGSGGLNITYTFRGQPIKYPKISDRDDLPEQGAPKPKLPKGQPPSVITLDPGEYRSLDNAGLIEAGKS